MKKSLRADVYFDVRDPNSIPPPIHRLHDHNSQPSRAEILIDNRFAGMTQQTFDKLQEYSCSIPSGVWEGKMWKSCPAKFYKSPTPASLNAWYLCWFGYSDKPGKCSNNIRRIVIVKSFK